MKAGFFLFFVLLLTPLPSYEKAKDNAEADQEKLVALENAWNQAQLHRDAKAVEQLLPDTFVYTDYDGTLMNKAAFLADVRDQNYRATSIVNSNMQVFPYQNMAIVVGTYRAKGTYKGKAFDHRGRFTDTWIFKGGIWQCAASHTTLIAKAQ